MGAPTVTIIFLEKAASAIERSERGIVALGLRDTATVAGSHVVYSVDDIPNGLSADNKQFVKDALVGYQKAPKKVLVYVMDTAGTVDTEYTKLLTYLATERFDWLAIPTVETDNKASDIATWIKGQRDNEDRRVKAVLPNTAADSDGIVNVTTKLYRGETEITAEKSAPRIAGLIAGTPMTISCTYAPLTDFTDCERMNREARDAAVDAGKLIPWWDGEKVKVCRGVNSFVTTTGTKGASFKKIKIVEIMDMIHDDIKSTAEDNYIGKYANSYDNKCLLIGAINAYFGSLVQEGIIASGLCEIDVVSQRNYLKGLGKKVILEDGTEKDVNDCTDDEIKSANTGSKVFLKANLSILDAIEDISMEIYI